MTSGDLSEVAFRAKQTLQKFVVEINPRFEQRLDEEIARTTSNNQKEQKLSRQLLLHLKEYLLRPQKRLRPAFVYYGYQLVFPPDERTWQAAIAIDVIHAAILMHDDFEDYDDIRRGGPTSHKFFEKFMGGGKHYGAAMAVNVGDMGWNLGDEILANCDFPAERVVKAMRFLFRTIVDTTYGQALDISMSRYGSWTENDVITVHTAKTARYTYENPLTVGTILAGAGSEILEVLQDYSMDGGVAFQLRDDILGVFGEPEETGKSANSDLLQGKCTLLVWHVLNHGSAAEREAVLKVWGKKKASSKDIKAAKAAIRSSGSLDYSVAKTKELAGKAVQTAQRLRKLNLNPQAIDFIQGVAQYMVERVV